MTDREALIKTIFGIILVLSTAFIGACVGAVIGAIRGPYYILAAMSDGTIEREVKSQSSDSTDRI